jgi:HD-like signal output (HDOD) protein
MVIPMIPGVIVRLIQELRNPDLQVTELEALIEQDPALCSKVLRLANSPFYGGRKQVGSIRDAIVMVGTEPLKLLTVACGVSAAFESVPGVDLAGFWRHAHSTAVLAKALALRFSLPGDEAFLAGLFHMVGHLILCCSKPERAKSEFDGADPLFGQHLVDAEVEAFGVSHIQVGGVWLDRLGIPDAVVEAVLGYLMVPPASELAQCLALASAALALDASDAALEHRLEQLKQDSPPFNQLRSGGGDD